jgi:hypothetical protein
MVPGIIVTVVIVFLVLTLWLHWLKPEQLTLKATLLRLFSLELEMKRAAHEEKPLSPKRPPSKKLARRGKSAQ